MENTENPQHSGPVNNFFGNINNYNVYNAPVTNSGPVYNLNGSKPKEAQREELADGGKSASEEMMIEAARITQKNGLWKSQRSWSVMFIVYCIWGYKGRVSDFLNEVVDWPEDLQREMVCNRYAVEKLKNTYDFSKDIAEWRQRGVPEQYCILGEQLDAELTKMAQTAE